MEHVINYTVSGTMLTVVTFANALIFSGLIFIGYLVGRLHAHYRHTKVVSIPGEKVKGKFE